MRFHLAVTFLDVPEALALGRAADELGYDGIYVSDHLFYPRDLQSPYTYSTRDDGAPFWQPDTPWPDPWCFVSAMAACTTRVRFTTGIYVAPARDLITVAKLVGTAAAISGGRVTLGVGVGWCREEFEATGQDFATRGKRLDDMIPALRALWKPGWVEYHGPWYDVAPMQMAPCPPAPVPILGGGHSAPALRRAAERCDGWMAAGAYRLDEARHHLAALRQARQQAGRADEPFDVHVALRERPDPDLYRRLGDEEGVTDLQCAPWMAVPADPDEPAERRTARRVDALARFADEVIAKVR